MAGKSIGLADTGYLKKRSFSKVKYRGGNTASRAETKLRILAENA